MLTKLVAVALLLASASTLAAPNKTNKLKKAKSPVPNSYIVVLKDGADKESNIKALNDLVVTFDDVKEVEYSNWEGMRLNSASSMFTNH